MRKTLFALAGAATLALGAFGAWAAGEAPQLPHEEWSFYGVFGTYNRASAQRGFQVYSEVCSNCHSMNLLHYRDLEALGYSEDEVKAFAAQRQVTQLDDQGKPVTRPARPSDKFTPPDPAVISVFSATPPDLSLMAKAREGGPDYIVGLLSGYKDPPADFKMSSDTVFYNEYFPGHQIAMPAPLTDDRVTYADGTKATLHQEAYDVATFLTWAAEPNLEQRYRTGVKVMFFLLVMTVALYGAKRKIWSDVH